MQIEQLLNNFTRIKVTLIGHSLGGLFIRGALKHLFETFGTNPYINWVGILTIESPHLGVRKPGGNIVKNIYKCIVHTVCDQVNGLTGDDLLGETNTLFDLAKEDYITKFKYFTLVGLAHHDMVVPFPTSGICPVNPYPLLNCDSDLSVVGCYGFSEPYLGLKWDTVNLGSLVQDQWVSDDVKYGNHDNYYHTAFDWEMIKRLYEHRDYAGNWRRVDLNIGKLFSLLAHDICIKKPIPVIQVQIQSDPASKLLELFSEILYFDHKH